jgi:hypothetical protein
LGRGSTTSETAEGTTRIISIRRARDVGALATLDSFAPTTEEAEKTLDEGDAPGSTGTLSGSR